ncbi:MAG: glycoside hydrolase family 15 protein [Bdellovibrionales bacterium]
MYPYGLIGNCQASALISDQGSIDWLCLPRPDSPPVFGKILDPEGGQFSIRPVGNFKSHQYYIPNTNVLVTHFNCEDGSEFQITDFCPRFDQYGRKFRPMALFRIVEPLKGTPQITVSCAPVNGWEKKQVKPIFGNSHLKFPIRGDYFRVITSMPLTYFAGEIQCSVNEKIYFGLTWSTGLEEDLAVIANRFLDSTIDYWRSWVKHCSIPALFQKETIRSALALKLHCYEDTGAILAALTSSLPEEIGSFRNWDYRFCWLRDAAFVLSAFHNLGHFEEMEGFLKFLLDIGHKHENSKERLSPVYALDQTLPVPEILHTNWKGFNGSGPVRSNNQAAEHTQNDVYGELILTLAPIFFDERFQHLRTKEHQELVQNLFDLCKRTINQPDAGLWEHRDGWKVHTFSNLMSWAGIERVSRLRAMGFLQDLNVDEVLSAELKAKASVLSASKDGIIRNGPKDDSMDAALLLLPILRFPDADLCKSTVLEIAKLLRLDDSPQGQSFLFRYIRKDDWGAPRSAFTICSFWLVQALLKVGEVERARDVMKNAMGAANNLGLFAEHFIPGGIQLGNYPQAYSHVGLINAAFNISPSWGEIL